MDSTAIIDLKQFIMTTVNESVGTLRTEMYDEFKGVHQRLTYTHGEIADLSKNIDDIKSEVGDLRSEVGNLKSEVSDLKSDMMNRFDEVYEFVGDMLVSHDERISRLEKRAA